MQFILLFPDYHASVKRDPHSLSTMAMIIIFSVMRVYLGFLLSTIKTPLQC